jgi:acetyl-CoA acetyltransferase
MEKFENRVRITGIGLSQVGRRLMRDPVGLAIEACVAALADAGLDRKQIDGLSSHPGPRTSNGYSGAGIRDVEEVLRVNPKWFNSGHEFAGHAGAVQMAALALAGGLCRHVLCFRSTWESTAAAIARTPAGGGETTIEGDNQWRLPFGAYSAGNWIGMLATRHFRDYGTTREQLGAIALNARRNAELNPNAVYRDPLTMDDYLGARMITTPFGLYDCDVPCDGAVAVVLSRVDTAADTRRKDPIRLEAYGGQTTERWSWDQGTLHHEPMLKGAADEMWSRTDLKPADVDVAELYDGFTFNCLSWIEMLGFCKVGEGGAFVEGGQRIARDGELPLNTHGGQLSGGRLQGFSFLHEACVQLWGEGGARQVPGDPQVAVVSTGGGTPGGAMLLTRG